MNKPFSQSCENNKTPILNVLSRYLTQPATLLEVGSGTGQHGVHMANHLPHITWQTSDIDENLAGIDLWRREFQLDNLLKPIYFNVLEPESAPSMHDHLFSANTLHIMSWQAVESFFKIIPSLMRKGGLAFFYGPFKYHGEYTSPNNADFDLWLKECATHQGIRDFEAIEALAYNAGLILLEDVSMPVNNQTLVWKRG
ncbi:MAG: DUF938 domain-containing protein [Spirochaetota bacterium]|nr:DUF938 domain-containing protein [Spirochaetota bacterium]